ncbi:MAG: thiol protease/hemagglutinin PrtT [Bacteroidota bacterium]|nr:thiol protease/hemagglutinin PrtT [Bacteroidota bacterium]
MKNLIRIKHLKMAVALVVTGFIFTAGLWAKDVPPEKAAIVAKNFIDQSFTTDSLIPGIPSDVYLHHTRISPSPDLSAQTQDLKSYYVFEFEGKPGFIIVSADDRAYPILGFSTQSGFDPKQTNPALRKWLDNYHTQIIQIITQKIPATAEIYQTWSALENGTPLKSIEASSSVNPLIQTRWDQSPHINDKCPYDSYSNKRTVTGCVATAVAQILKYWNYPEQGTGFHTYNHSDYGSLSANFGGTMYQWNQMPNYVNSANSAVATLLFHVGVSVEMDYGVRSSSASTFEYSPGLHSGEFALKEYFGYNTDLYGARRSNYTDSQWSALLRTELDDGRPMLYRGSGTGGGHAFVCDGYSSSTFFHFNWGWGGYQDGYFHINALNPGEVGTGGGDGGFNDGHRAGIGIKPPTGVTSYDLRLYDNLTADPNPLTYGNAFTVHFDIANYGETGFRGDFCVALFDKDINFIDFVGTKTDWSLSSNSHYEHGINLESQGSFSFLPGSYTLAAFYRPTGENWTLLSNNGDYQNLTDFSIEFANDIEVYGGITLSTGGTITQNQAFDVHLNIANAGDTDFNGIVDVSLYDLEGTFIETVDAYNVELASGYYLNNGLDFNSQGITADPGTYLLALQYNHNEQGWELAGSSYQTNPIKVIVKVAPILADPYENNNSRSEAYIFQPYFSNDRYAFDTEGSSMHNSEDYDFYGLNLQGGYTYYVTGRLHDSFSSTNGNTYTNDCLVSLMLDEYTSDVYDDELPNFKIIMHSNGTAIFYVSPYFEGKKGTYLLDIQVRREYGTGIDEIEHIPELSIYPNPAENELNINLIDFNDPIRCIEIIDLQGKIMMREEKDYINNESIHLDIQHIPNGVYTIRLIGKELYQTQFIKGK